MRDTWLAIRVSVLILLLVFGAMVWLPEEGAFAASSGYLQVRFLDVGQGDAIHIFTPDGYEMLIDGGPSAAVLRELTEGRSFFDRYIDVVVATHPDSDHIAGLVDVLKRYEVGWIVESGAVGDSQAALAFAGAASTEGATLIYAQAGQTFQLGASTTVRILSPRGDTSAWETNTASVVVQVIYGDIEFMLTGDAPQSIEEYLAGAYGAGLESEVLKLGHHGSKTSSGQIFLNTVRPEYAVVSAGADNRYGHPNAEVVARAGEAGARIVSTAESGTITFLSDGNEVWTK